MKPLKVIFNRPIYRKDILRYASKHYDSCRGMCWAIKFALDTYKIHAVGSDIFSEYFNLRTAMNKFSATTTRVNVEYDCYWWSNNKYGWHYRKRYFKWLIKQYKNDKEDLRKYR